MILTRILRGAKRTHNLIKKGIAGRCHMPISRQVRAIRSVSLSLFAARIVLLPIPLPTTDTALAATGSEPPSTQRIAASSADALILSKDLTNPALVVTIPLLQNVEVGKSLATIEAEEAAKEAEQLRLEEEARQKKNTEALARRLAQQQASVRIQTVSAPVPVSVTGSVQDIAHQITVAAFGETFWPAMNTLIMRESGYNLNSYNARSGACGLPQALPCSKIKDRSAEGQVWWMVHYIQARYGNPLQALWHHNAYHWY